MPQILSQKEIPERKECYRIQTMPINLVERKEEILQKKILVSANNLHHHTYHIHKNYKDPKMQHLICLVMKGK